MDRGQTFWLPVHAIATLGPVVGNAISDAQRVWQRTGYAMHGFEYWRQAETANLPDTFDAANPDEWTQLANLLPTPCWVALADGYIVWYNKRWHDYCGSTPDQMAGWGWQSVHDPDALAEVIESWRNSISSGEPFEMTFPLLGDDGRFRPFLTRIIPVRNSDGTIVRWFGVNTEISAQRNAERALERSEAEFSTLTDVMPQMVWSTKPDGYHDYYNAQWYAYTGVPEGSTDGEGWAGMFHPEDQPAAWERWLHSLATGDLYEVEYRLRRHDGEYRWMLGRALPVRDEGGEIIRWIGTCTEIHEGKQLAEQSDLLSRELSHRIKNLFAVIGGLLSLTGRDRPETAPLMAELTSRISALGRAHNFTRPHSEISATDLPEGKLRGLIAELVEPYQDVEKTRIEIDCDEIEIDDRGATPIALALHELATNSAKYGSLSVTDGKVKMVARLIGEEVHLNWRETGGPAIVAPPETTGFGMRLTDISVERQLGGTLTRNWAASGLEVTIIVKHSHLHRGGQPKT